MFTKKSLGIYKIALALLVLSAVAAQYLDRAHLPTFNPVNFFSFFTIESNIVAAIIFALIGVAYLVGRDGSKLTLLRGAATLYMTVTGIVYSLLLAGNEEALNTTLPWVNFVLHYLFPFLAFADWFIDRPVVRVTFRQSLAWLVFPVAYLSYSLVRGVYTGWYPYPFLNPADGGYGKVAFVVSCITVVGVMLCGLFAKVSSGAAKTAPAKTRKK